MKLSIELSPGANYVIAVNLAEAVNRIFFATIPIVEEKVKRLVKESLEASPEYSSIINGQLKGELGLPNPDVTIDAVIEFIVNAVKVEFKPFKIFPTGLVRGEYNVYIIRPTIEELTALPNAAIVTERGYVLEWLDWLLTYGGKIIIRGHEVDFDLSTSDRQRSRTGLALMRRGLTEDDGVWRVPSQFRGNASDNFIIRSFKNTGYKIKKIIESSVGEAIVKL